jgi:pimeloyl-ACP methyl ester carboxylesterase
VLEQTALALQALGAQPLLTDHALARIVCPVRLAVGDRDVTVPVEELRDTSRTLARGEYEVLPRTPHPFEKVPLERLAWTLRQFISSASA